MTVHAAPEPAAQPEDLGRLFLERANAGDVEGLVALYEPGAVLARQAEQGLPAQPQRLLGLAGLQPAARLAECDQRAVEEFGR